MPATDIGVLADLPELLREIRPDWQSPVTGETVLHEALGTDIAVIDLLGRLQGRYEAIDLGPLLRRQSVDSIRTLRAGELADTVDTLLATASPPPVTPEPAPGPERAIVISNGRSGSTLLSDLLAQQPDTLAAQEFFRVIGQWDRCDTVVSGAEYWALLSAPGRTQNLLGKLGRRPKEHRYPGTGRFAGGAVPRILLVTMPKITDDPDGLFDVLATKVPGFPADTVGGQHRRFLDLLAGLTGKTRWVERSGGSSEWTPALLRLYPEAKFVHLTRNLDDTARSMSRHSSFQLHALRSECLDLFGFDPFGVPDGMVVPESARRYLPGNVTVQALDDVGQDLRRFRWASAYMSALAEQALADAPPTQLHTLRYEDLLADPVSELDRLGRFLAFPDAAQWAAQVAGQVRRPA